MNTSSSAGSLVASSLIAVLSVMVDKISSLLVIFSILLFLMFADYVTAVIASVYKRRGGIKSHKTQWSFSKYIIYLMVVCGTLLLGILLHSMYCFLNFQDVAEPSYILQFTIHLVVAIMLLIVWNESVSITENVLIFHPNNKVFSTLHSFLAFEVIKKIPLFNMSKYYKSEKDKNKNHVDKTQEVSDEDI